jgi:heptosyltransferase-2
VKNIRQESVKKILIRSVNWIGDAVMTTPAISVIREHFPHAEIAILANPMVSQLFLHHPGIDTIITFDRQVRHHGVAGRVRLAAELRTHAFDLAIILPNSFDSALVPWLAGIPAKIGKCSDGRTLLLNGRYNAAQGPPGCHEVDYYLNLLNYFGISGSRTSLNLFTTSVEEGRAKALLGEFGVQSDDFILGINPGASYGSAKRWYPDRFAQVARRLADTLSAKIVIFGGPGETEIASDIENRLEGTAVNMAGKTSVRELMALIKRCNFFVTNDSGPMHIAAAFDVPLVAIFGPTDHTGTSPYNSTSVVVRTDVECAPCKLRECPTDHRCMTSVTSESVISAALGLADRLHLRDGKQLLHKDF